MTSGLQYCIFDTAMGWVGAVKTAKGLLRSTLPQSSEQEVRRLLGESTNLAVWSPDAFHDLSERLKSYFIGRRVAFPDELDLSAATPFQRRVWEVTRLIPCGETRSYSQVAEQAGNAAAARAVGQALGKNPLPIIIPCHRVLASNGGLGGFGGGLVMKKRLLSLERNA